MAPLAGGSRVARLSRLSRLSLLACVLASVLASVLAPAPALAQRQLDRLQIVSLGVSAGGIVPSQVEPTNVFSLSADYGELAAGWRLQFAVTYWGSRMRQPVIEEFVQALEARLDDPSGVASLSTAPITIYDAAFGVGVRRVLSPRSWMSTYYTVGVAAHVMDAEGALIEGTFVERALDEVATGLYGAAGTQVRLGRVLLEGELRGDLLSGFRSAQARAGMSYFFGERRRSERD
jgi:hypothetical protein